MLVQEIKNAVDSGKIVRWANSSYTVIKDSKDQYLIKSGDHCIGLTWADGETLNGKPEQFYIEANVTMQDIDDCYPDNYNGVEQF